MFPTTAQLDDPELARRIIEFLNLRQLAPVAELDVRTTGGLAVVRGQVASERDRRLCIECCRHVAGVVRVVDELCVNDWPARTVRPGAVGQSPRRNIRAAKLMPSPCG
jgi:osmotically-inducible protein OsmY